MGRARGLAGVIRGRTVEWRPSSDGEQYVEIRVVDRDSSRPRPGDFMSEGWHKFAKISIQPMRDDNAENG